MSGSPFPFKELLIKLSALLSFCGGPLLFADLLKPRLGMPIAFGVSFLPIALMIFGALCLDGTGGGTFEIRLVRLGFAGSLIALNMHLYAAYLLATATTRRPDHGLYVVGLLVGIPTSVGYSYLANRWLSRCGAKD